MADVELTVDMETARALRNALKLGKGIDKVDNKTIKLNSSMANIGKYAAGAGAAVGAAFLGAAYAGKKAADSSIDFQDQMAKANTILRVSDQDLKQWSSTVTKIATDTGVAASEGAAALFDIASAGFKGAEAIDVLRASMRGASAGFTSAKDISGGLIAAMKTFGVTATEALDNVFFATNKGIMEASDYAKALTEIGGVAENAGLDLKDVAVAMATITKTGLKADVGKTQVQGFLRAMTKGDTQKKLGKLVGENVWNIRDKGFVATLKMLRNLREEIGLDKFAAIFTEDEAKKGALGLLNASGQTIEALRDLAKETEGFAAAAEKFAESPAKVLKRQQEEIDGIVRSIGSEFVPAYLEIMKEVTEALSENKEGLIEFGKMIGAIVSAGVGTVGTAGKAVSEIKNNPIKQTQAIGGFYSAGQGGLSKVIGMEIGRIFTETVLRKMDSNDTKQAKESSSQTKQIKKQTRAITQ